MKPNEILEPVIKLSTLATDIQFWISDEKEERFKEIKNKLSFDNSSYLMIQIPDSIAQLSAVEMTDLYFQINEDMGRLSRMLYNLDSNKPAYVLYDTDFDLSPEFHRIVYLSVFNALNLLRSFDRAFSQTFHPSGEIGLKLKETSNGLLEKIYNDLETEGLI